MQRLRKDILYALTTKSDNCDFQGLKKINKI